jgi:hypothetical protein
VISPVSGSAAAAARSALTLLWHAGELFASALTVARSDTCSFATKQNARQSSERRRGLETSVPCLASRRKGVEDASA